MRNIVFIDWQNLHLWTTKNDPSWKVDFKKLRIYLKENYWVGKAYYFLWYVKDWLNDLYQNLQEAWFIVIFKKQLENMKSTKRGNIDVDLVFHTMKTLIDDSEWFDKIIIISDDGDYKQLVDYLVKKERFLKILFPSKYASSLYKSMWSEYFDYLKNIRKYIEYTWD